MNLKKRIFLICSLGLVLFAGCKGGAQNNDATEKPSKPKKEYPNDLNPTYGALASESQDFIFNLDSMGFTTITIRRSEWNKMLSYYDYFYKNENSVIAESYEYQKDGQTWKLNTVGLRLRGNTSRYRPQGKDYPTDETYPIHHREKPNYGWDDKTTGYYHAYSQTCSDDDYRQSHFKVDFEPLDDDDRKMSNCMKGVALKRSDSYFSKEIFCYNLFHKYGIWTAPRASQTHVTIKFIEDIDTDGDVEEDISNCKTTKIDFGVYEMFEEVNKQSLKGRQAKSGNNTAENAWKTNEGDLWKCAGGDLTSNSNAQDRFGCESIKIINADLPKERWSFEWYSPCYDLKTNKDKVRSATNYFRQFITELNNTSLYAPDTQKGIADRKAFYEKWFDVDFFIKTYAVNILVGMDDDYWGNANNYYLYFDNSKNGSGKCYFIPFDYDNTLGSSIDGDKTYTNPLEWGTNKDGHKHDRPLLDRLIEVPEYKTKLINALLEVSSQDPSSPWNKENCYAVWRKLFSQARGFAETPDIKGWPNISSISVHDDGGWKEHKHYLTEEGEDQSSNLYEQVTLNYNVLLTDNKFTIRFDPNGGELNGQTDIVSVDFDGVSSYENMISAPVRLGHDFVGWTKTKDGDDITTTFCGEKDLILYAKWYSVPTEVSVHKTEFDCWKETSPEHWTNVGTHDDVTFAVEAKTDGLHITKSHESKRINVKIKDVTTGKDLLFIDNVDKCNDEGDTTPLNEFVYPFVEKDHVYSITLELNDVHYTEYHTFENIKVKAIGGKGDIYVSHNGKYEFNIEDLSFEFEDLEIHTQAIKDKLEHHRAYFFTNGVWGNIYKWYDDEGNEKNSAWSERWELDSQNQNKIHCGLMDWGNNKIDFVPLEPKTSEVYVCIRYEFTDSETKLTYITNIIEGQVYPAKK